MSTLGTTRDIRENDDTPLIITDTERVLNREMQLGVLGSVPTNWQNNGGGGTAELRQGKGFTPEYGDGFGRAARLIRTLANPVQFDSDFTAQGTVAYGVPYMLTVALSSNGGGPGLVNLKFFTRDIVDVVAEHFNTGPSYALPDDTAWHFVHRWGIPEDAGGHPDTSVKWQVRVELPTGHPLNNTVYVGLVHFGPVAEFTKGFHKFRHTTKYFQHLTPGSDDFQIVENGEPQLETRFGMDNVVRGSQNDLAWLQFIAEAQRTYDSFVPVVESSETFALWRNGSRWLHAEDHFERVHYIDDAEWKSKGGIDTFEMVADVLPVLSHQLHPEHIAQ